MKHYTLRRKREMKLPMATDEGGNSTIISVFLTLPCYCTLLQNTKTNIKYNGYEEEIDERMRENHPIVNTTEGGKSWSPS